MKNRNLNDSGFLLFFDFFPHICQPVFITGDIFIFHIQFIYSGDLTVKFCRRHFIEQIFGRPAHGWFDFLPLWFRFRVSSCGIIIFHSYIMAVGKFRFARWGELSDFTYRDFDGECPAVEFGPLDIISLVVLSHIGNVRLGTCGTFNEDHIVFAVYGEVNDIYRFPVNGIGIVILDFFLVKFRGVGFDLGTCHKSKAKDTDNCNKFFHDDLWFINCKLL